MPTPRKGESKKKFLSRCMGDKEALADFPKNDQRYAFCTSQWSRNMDETPVLHLATATLQGTLREEEFQGRAYLAVPAVLVQGQVLHNNLGATFLPPEEITDQWALEWNGAPVVIHDHPSMRGVPVSARSPEVLDQYGVGFVFKARAVRNGTASLKGEVWLDVDRASEIPELQTIIHRLRSGGRVELSTGFSVAAEDSSGIYNGEEYTRILHPFGADHLAIFSDKIGACSVDDGCGLGVHQRTSPKEEVTVDRVDNQECERGRMMRVFEGVLSLLQPDRKTPDKPTSSKNTTTGPEARLLLRRLKAAGMTNEEIGAAVGRNAATIGLVERGEINNPAQEVLTGLQQLAKQHMSGNADQSDEERRSALINALESEFGGTNRMVWIDAVYSEEKMVVFGVVHETLQGRKEELYRSTFDISEAMEVTFTNPETVVRQVVYKAVAGNREETDDMADKDKDTKSSAPATQAQNKDEPTGQEPKDAPKGAPKGEGAVPKADEPKVQNVQDAPKNEPKQAVPKGEDKDVVITALQKQVQDTTDALNELREIVKPAIDERDRERQNLVAELAKNERVPFDQAELEAKPLEELRKLQAMSRGVSYSGRGGPQAPPVATNEDEQFAEPVPYYAQQKNGKTPEKGEGE